MSCVDKKDATNQNRERKRAAAPAAYKRFRHKAKTLAQAEFISAEHLNPPRGGAPQSGAEPKKDVGS